MAHQQVNPFGIGLCQYWCEAGTLLGLINHYQVKTVVELGVLSGGFGALVAGYCQYDHGFIYLGVESNRGVIDERFWQQHRERLLIGDCFTAPVLERVGALLRAPGRALILCDNGDKPRELRVYWPLLKPGDLIAAHDYAPEPGYGVEIGDRDIAPYLDALRPIPLEYGGRLIVLERI